MLSTPPPLFEGNAPPAMRFNLFPTCKFSNPHVGTKHLLALYTKEQSRRDYKIFPDTMSDWKLLSRLKAVGLAYGIRTPLTWHCARHMFDTLTLEAGVPIESIAKMMGHSPIASTQIYAQVTDQKIARDMERVMQKLL